MEKIKLTLIIILSFLLLNVYGSDKLLFVSTKGNDNNPGTKAKPLATLKRAQAKVRSLKGKVTVYIRGGVYYLSEPLVFTNKDSRKQGDEVVFKSYPGEKVAVSGGRPLLLKWDSHHGAIKKAKIGQSLLFDQLFINGKQQRMARYPNYNPGIKIFGGYAADAIEPARVKRWSNPEGGFVHAMHKHEWGGYQYQIMGKTDKDSLLLEGGYQNNRQMGMHNKNRFVENIFEELDTVGEWFLNKKEQMLYYYPPAGIDLSKALVEVPLLESVFEFKGTAENPVTNISIEGIEIKHTLRTFMKTKEPLLRSDWTIYRSGALFMEGAENCLVKNVFFNTVGGNAVFMSNYNRNNKIEDCHIAYAGASGVCFVGDPKAVRSPSFEYHEFVPLKDMDTLVGPKTNNYPAKCSVENTLMYGLGQVEKQVAGVQISMAMDITVSHNTIYNVPRAGINISEGTWGGHVIAYNDVFNTVLESGDHGAFNSWGRDRYWHSDYKQLSDLTAAHPNLVSLDAIKTVTIHDNRFRCDHGWDIDLDDGSSNYHIYNNVCLNGGLKLREGFNRIVENNIMINNSFHPHVWFKNSGDVFRYNIVGNNYAPIRLQAWGKQVDFNLFPDQNALLEAQKEGVDEHSAFGQPGFVDAGSGDYRVNPESPALKLGFKNFPMNRFGVTSAALKAVAQSVQLPAVVTDVKGSGTEKYDFFGTVVKNLNTLGERSATGMASETGVLVLDVPKNSVLHGKLLPNDVILSLNSAEVKDVKSLVRIRMGLQFHSSTKIEVFRNQSAKQLEIPLK